MIQMAVLLLLTAHYDLLVSSVCSLDLALQAFGLDFLLVSSLLTETQLAFD